MSRRKVAPWLLAASVFLTGATGILAGAFTPANAITSVEELRDVDTSGWAYQALADLVEKYDVIEGYPDHTFKGNRNATRYEMAAALNALIKAVGRDLARLGAEKANKSDLATLAKLQEEFRNELAALNAKEAALESRASAIEAKNNEQDKRLDLLEKTQLHGDLSLGLLADWGDSGQATTGNDGITDSIGVLGRFRLGLKVPVYPGYDNSSVGEGDVIARLVGAFGRWTPANVNSTGSTNPFPIAGYSAIAGNSSFYNEGVRPDSYTLGSALNGNGGFTAGLNTRQNLYVESAFYKQHFKPGIPVLSELPFTPDNDKFRTTSDLYAGIIPWRNLFDRSPYRGDELNQFQNTALVNNQGFLVNNVAPTIALAWHQGLGNHLSADLTGAVSTFDTADVMNGFNVTEELNFNYDTAFLGPNYTKPGSIYVGGYHIFFNGDSTLSQIVGNVANRNGALLFPGATGNRDQLNAFFWGWNQEWWRGIGTSFNWVINQNSPYNSLISSLRNGTGVNAALHNTALSGTPARIVGVQQAISTTLTVPLTVFNKDLTARAKDVLGFGYSWIRPNEQGDATTGVGTDIDSTDEHIFEGFYRWVVNDSISIVPSVQAIVNRFGVEQNGTVWVLGLRTNYVF